MSRWPRCTDLDPCKGDTCDWCIARRLARRRFAEAAHYTMRERPQRSPLYLVAAFGLRNPVVCWAVRRGLSDERVDYQLQSNDFGDAESLRVALRAFPSLYVEMDPRNQELRG